MKSLNRLKVLCHAINGPYRYSLRDKIGYLRHAEYPCDPQSFPKPEILGHADGFTLVRIGEDVYNWPATSRINGLEWMHAEVFEPAAINFHAYEYGGARLREGDYVVDAGACEGFFVRYALNRGADVLAIEPTPSVAEALKRTFADAIAKQHVEIQCAALGATTYAGKLKQRSDNQLYENALADSGDDVQILALDEVLSDRQLDFLKMDIEGGEMAALRGAQAVLRRWKPKISVAVYHGIDNARMVMDLIGAARDDYHVMHRGIFAWDNQPPRPMMVHAW